MADAATPAGSASSRPASVIIAEDACCEIGVAQRPVAPMEVQQYTLSLCHLILGGLQQRFFVLLDCLAGLA